ncbi:uncharacterized protein LOC108921615 isoform X1 [Scleropages formosus]|uniref:E3 ubiquitin-protein ligase MARCHF2 n=1 Tax=Scleropages formosus TaxID=113540 RepID=A0A8C9TWI3_SCLFO|nr:uncharacterized protein LOC108921615 isoform X1 [Scleropages formosus]
MTTGQCCHLPGSLCDCTGGADLSKAVQEADGRQARYVTQVTTKDGRLLSTVIRALGMQSDGPICRICHEGGNGEGLLSPCDCTGTLGTVHRSCLEKWLSSSNTSYCELCHTEFSVERRPRPLTEVSGPFLTSLLEGCLLRALLVPAARPSLPRFPSSLCSGSRTRGRGTRRGRSSAIWSASSSSRPWPPSRGGSACGGPRITCTSTAGWRPWASSPSPSPSSPSTSCGPWCPSATTVSCTRSGGEPIRRSGY